MRATRATDKPAGAGDGDDGTDMTPKRRPGRPRTAPVEVQRAQILDAARRVFAEHDYHGSTLEQVARAAGVARPLVYELYGGKDQLFVAVVDDAVERILGYFTLSSEERESWMALSLRRRVRMVVARMAEFVEERPDEATMLRLAEFGGFGPAKSEIVVGRQTIEERLGRLILEIWTEVLPVTEEASRLAALAILSAVEAVVFRQPLEPTWDKEACIDVLTTMIIASLVALTEQETLVTTFGTEPAR